MMFRVKIPGGSSREITIAFKIIDGPGLGDCLFDSILEFLKRNNRIYKDVPLSSHQLRLKIVQFICSNPSNYFADLKINLRNQLPELSELSQSDALEKYRIYMSSPKVFGTYVELCAARDF